jgi:hypothetical protein
MNRKGHMGTILMPIGTFALVVVVLLVAGSFNSSFGEENLEIENLNAKFKLDKEQIEEVCEFAVMGAIEVADKDKFKKNFEENFASIVNELDRPGQRPGNFFGLIRNGDFLVISEGEGVYRLVIEGIEISSKSSSGNSEIRRSFDLVKRFDSTGVLE